MSEGNKKTIRIVREEAMRKGNLHKLDRLVEDQIAEDDKVATRISGRGMHSGEIMGAAPTGKKLTWSALVVSRFVDSKIAEEWVEFDGLSLLQQLGVIPEKP